MHRGFHNASCEEVIAEFPDALVRRAMAFEELKEWDQAVQEVAVRIYLLFALGHLGFRRHLLLYRR
eukprot:44953-Amphidinium_carterae.1